MDNQLWSQATACAVMLLLLLWDVGFQHPIIVFEVIMQICGSYEYYRMLVSNIPVTSALIMTFRHLVLLFHVTFFTKMAHSVGCFPARQWCFVDKNEKGRSQADRSLQDIIEQNVSKSVASTLLVLTPLLLPSWHFFCMKWKEKFVNLGVELESLSDLMSSNWSVWSSLPEEVEHPSRRGAKPVQTGWSGCQAAIRGRHRAARCQESLAGGFRGHGGCISHFTSNR